MDYKVDFSQNAKKDLDKLEKEISVRILKKLKEIKEDPVYYTKRLVGSMLYSLRVGDYRVLMAITPSRIFIVKIGHRREVYE